jgi:hypothetical protein
MERNVTAIWQDTETFTMLIAMSTQAQYDIARDVLNPLSFVPWTIFSRSMGVNVILCVIVRAYRHALDMSLLGNVDRLLRTMRELATLEACFIPEVTPHA